MFLIISPVYLTGAVHLREQLLSVEEERMVGSKQYTIDELDQILDAVIKK